MSYKFGFDGVMTAELQRLLQSVEGRVNGLAMQVQTSDTGSSTVASGYTPSPCPAGQSCPDSVKGPHDIVVVIVIAIVAGAAAGYMAGKRGAKRVLESVKGPHD